MRFESGVAVAGVALIAARPRSASGRVLVACANHPALDDAPSHVSMLSGFTPDAHQMVWDDYTTERGPIPVPRIGVAHGQGRRTAMIAGKHNFT
jgi:hypothetical protein